MEPATRLFWLSFSMLIGCYIFGSIPLTLSFTERNMRSVSIGGAGLIVGTALSVIIPEGVHAMYDSVLPHNHGHGHESHAHGHAHTHQKRSLQQTNEQKQLIIDNNSPSGAWENFNSRLPGLPEVELHSMIGISLSLGFIFMLLVDQLFGGGHSHGGSDGGNRKSATATLGLLVHAAADGIALGAAASTTRSDIEMIVFFAIMLHKAPAAFGLSSFLLHENMERNRIRKHLLAFSLAAPIFSMLTYYGLSASGKQTFTSYNGTGLAMLFSAGTFLYVATVHILPELLSQPSNSLDNSSSQTHGKLTRKELCYLVIGIFTPVILGLYHKH